MQTKIIGFDIDDTLTNSDKFIRSMLDEFMIMKNLPLYTGPIRMDKYSLEEKFPRLNSRIISEFNSFLFPRLVNNAPVREEAKELLDELKKLGYRIQIITRRDKDYDKGPYKGSMMVEHTIAWFHRNELPYDEIVFSSFDKLKTCNDCHAKILFEDAPSNILRVSKDIPVIVPSHEYNKHMIGKNIHVVETLNPEKILPLIESLTLF